MNEKKILDKNPQKRTLCGTIYKKISNFFDRKARKNETPSRMRQLQVRLQRLALPDMENQIPEGQGNSLKGIDKKTGRREGASYSIYFFQNKISE